MQDEKLSRYDCLYIEHFELLEQALKLLKSDISNTIMIGDRLDTDILGANQIGITSLLVLTGVTSRDMLQTSIIQPDIIMNGLPDITSSLESHKIK